LPCQWREATSETISLAMSALFAVSERGRRLAHDARDRLQLIPPYSALHVRMGDNAPGSETDFSYKFLFDVRTSMADALQALRLLKHDTNESTLVFLATDNTLLKTQASLFSWVRTFAIPGRHLQSRQFNATSSWSEVVLMVEADRLAATSYSGFSSIALWLRKAWWRLKAWPG